MQIPWTAIQIGTTCTDAAAPAARDPGSTAGTATPAPVPAPGPLPSAPPATPTPTPPPSPAPGVIYTWGNGWDCIGGLTAEMSYNATFGLNSAAAPKMGELYAMTVCRKVGDVGSILQGAGESAGGGTIAGLGAVSCGTVVLCFVGGGVATVGGTAIAAHGGVTAVSGTGNLVTSAYNCLAAIASGGGGGGGPPPTPPPVPTPVREIPWSSPKVRQAAKELQNGATEVRVQSREEAEELFLRLH